MNAPQDFRNMTADTIGKDLLQALVMELKLLPEPWPKLTKKKQDDIIDRLRNRVETNVKMAVHMLAAEGRTVVAGDLDQITIKDGVKAVVKFGTGAANLHELYEVAGKSVLVVVANAADHTGGMSDVQGEDDQRAMDLGHEYHDNDGGGMDDQAGDGNVIEGEVLGLPAPGNTTPTEEELQQTFEAGYQAAADGKPESDCPIIRSELVIEWIRGWKAWQEEQTSGEETTEEAGDPLYSDAVAIVQAEKRVSISLIQRRLMIGYNRAARLVEEIEAKGVVSAQDADGKRTVIDNDERKAA